MAIIVGLVILAVAAQDVPQSAQLPASAPASSEAGDTSGPIVAVAKIAPAYTLPANTEVFMTLNEELSSKRVEEGQMFGLTISHDIMLGQFIVVPKGTPAYGEVTWKTGRAVFGKSGKMEIELRYIDLNGRRIPISGKYRQEGEGSTVAAVGAAVIAAPLMVITGKSARIPEGREFKAYTREALPVALPEGAVIEPETIKATAPVPAAPITAAAPSAS